MKMSNFLFILVTSIKERTSKYLYVLQTTINCNLHILETSARSFAASIIMTWAIDQNWQKGKLKIPIQVFNYTVISSRLACLCCGQLTEGKTLSAVSNGNYEKIIFITKLGLYWS